MFQWTEEAGRVLPEIAKKAKKQSKKDFVLQEVRVIFVNLFFLQA